VRILATFVGGWGHAEPLVAIANLATRRGHEVTFAGQASVVARLGDLGFDIIAVGPETVGPTRRALVAVDREHELRVIKDHFAGTFADQRAHELDVVIARHRPDVVVCDEVDFGAMIAAELHHVPRLSVSVIAAGLLTGPDVVGEPLRRLRHSHGLPMRTTTAMLGGDGVIVPVPPSFRNPDSDLPPAACFVRPPILDSVAILDSVVTNAPLDGPARRPLVYATLGTIFNVESGDLFARFIAAAGNLDADVVISVGPYVDPAELGPVPDHIRVESYVDHAELLPRCDAVVCHGGSGTTISALALGVPLVLLPMGADQPDNADRCTALGVGLQLDALTVTPSDLAAAVGAVLGDTRYRERASELATECRALPPTGYAVDLIEEVAAGRA
jgi:UDP:flavonoid glycosyltransferase YjiC (YdhE family)